MPRHRSRKNKSRSKRMSGGSYSSATTYGQYVNGSGGSQWDRTMDQSGSYGKIQGNTIIGAQGQNVTPSTQVPSAAQMSLDQKAGRRGRRGGFLGEVINQAIVPFSILAAQQTFRRKKGGSKGTRKRRNRRR